MKITLNNGTILNPIMVVGENATVQGAYREVLSEYVSTKYIIKG